MASVPIWGTSSEWCTFSKLQIFSIFWCSRFSGVNFSLRRWGLFCEKQLLKSASTSTFSIHSSSWNSSICCFRRNCTSMASRALMSISSCRSSWQKSSGSLVPLRPSSSDISVELRFSTFFTPSWQKFSQNTRWPYLTPTLGLLRQFFSFLQNSTGVSSVSLKRCILALGFLPIFSRWSSLSMMCWGQGVQCSLGQVNLKWLNFFPQYSHGSTQNSSGMFLILSLRKQNSSQSMSLYRNTSMNRLQLSWQSTENLRDLIQQRGLSLEMKSRLVRKGLSPALTRMQSTISSLKPHPCFLQEYPISPSFRIIRLKSSSMCLMVSCGCVMRTSRCSAKLQRVRSSRSLKKTRFLNTVRLAQRRQLTLSVCGSWLMNSLSSSQLNFFFRLDDSSMQLLIWNSSSSGTWLLVVSFLKILNFLLRFSFSARMLVRMAPMQLMLQAITMQLKVSMKMRQMASVELEAMMSPNPTVSMMLAAQQQDQMQRYVHSALATPFVTIQLLLRSMCVIPASRMQITWAMQKLTRNTFANYQYCSLQMLRMKCTSSFSILPRQAGSLNTMNSRRQLMPLMEVLMSSSRMMKLATSTQKDRSRQYRMMSSITSTFLPAQDLIDTRFIPISSRQKSRLLICSVDSRLFSLIKSWKAMDTEQMNSRHRICSTLSTLRKLLSAWGTSTPLPARMLSPSMADRRVNWTGVAAVEVLRTFLMNISFSFFIFWLRIIPSRMLLFSKISLQVPPLLSVIFWCIWSSCLSNVLSCSSDITSRDDRLLPGMDWACLRVRSVQRSERDCREGEQVTSAELCWQQVIFSVLVSLDPFSLFRDLLSLTASKVRLQGVFSRELRRMWGVKDSQSRSNYSLRLPLIEISLKYHSQNCQKPCQLTLSWFKAHLLNDFPQGKPILVCQQGKNGGLAIQWGEIMMIGQDKPQKWPLG